MRVHVENDLYISADGRQYTLERLTVTQSGKNIGEENYSTIGYFPSLKACVEKVVHLKISESTATTLGELLGALKEIREDINTAFIHAGYELKLDSTQ